MALWMKSLPSPELVVAVVAENYGLAVNSCVLLRSLTNEVYEIAVAGGHYALKLYRQGRWSPAEVDWEQQLVRALVSAKITTAAPVPLSDGRLVGVLDAPEGPRAYALTSWVKGIKPTPPWTDDLYRDFGRLIARFHAATAEYAAGNPRAPFDLSQSTAAVVEALADDQEHQDRVRGLGQQTLDQLARLRTDGLPEGILHGDASLDNLHVTPEGLVLHDFDLTGRGFPAADLTGALSTEYADAFLAGYRSVRALTDVELRALPWLRATEVIINLEFHLVTKPAILGSCTKSEGWVDAGLRALDALCRELDPTLNRPTTTP
jgi:Ser/Thr protein kinase RdoA (MazF antagonist)